MSNSTHKVEIVPVSLQKHPDSENLSIVPVWGYQCVVRTNDWIGIDKAAYIPPDSIVNTDRSEFSWLKTDKTKERVKVRRLRGILSMGLLIPAPPNSEIGDDVTDLLEVEHWNLPETSNNGDNSYGPPVHAPKYDVDSWYRYLDHFQDGEPVSVTEKLNGQNFRCVYVDGIQYVGSRNYWKKEFEDSLWWQIFYNNPCLKEFCKNNPGYVIYGEHIGKVGGFPYDSGPLGFKAFDILMPSGQYLNVDEFLLVCKADNIPTVPVIKTNWPLDKQELIKMAEGKSLIGDHVREGVVLKPMKERYSQKLGRVFLKVVGEGYYNKSK